MFVATASLPLENDGKAGSAEHQFGMKALLGFLDRINRIDRIDIALLCLFNFLTQRTQRLTQRQ